MTGESSSLFDDNVFIGNYAVEMNVVTNVGVLQQDAVFDNRSLAYVYTTEDDGVFYLALNGATVCDHAVADLGGAIVFGGRAVADLGKDLTVTVSKKIGSDVILKHLHRNVEIAFKRVDRCAETVVNVGTDVLLFELTGDDIVGKTCVTVCNGIGYDVLQIGTADNHFAQRSQCVAGQIAKEAVVIDIGIALFVKLFKGEHFVKTIGKISFGRTAVMEMTGACRPV